MIEEIIIVGKIVLATFLYLLVFQTTIKLHDYFMIRRIRKEVKNEN